MATTVRYIGMATIVWYIGMATTIWYIGMVTTIYYGKTSLISQPYLANKVAQAINIYLDAKRRLP